MVVAKSVVKRNKRGVRYNMKNTLLNILKITGIAIVVFSLILSSIISHDEHHIEECHDDDCVICQMIIMAQCISKVTVLIIIASFLAFVIYFILSRIHRIEIFSFQNSLIFQKVQFNN